MQSSLFASTKAKNLNPFANITSVSSIMNALRPRTMNSKSYAAVIKCSNEVFVTVVEEVLDKIAKISDALISGNKVAFKAFSCYDPFLSQATSSSQNNGNPVVSFNDVKGQAAVRLHVPVRRHGLASLTC
jgi:hypothetical protein